MKSSTEDSLVANLMLLKWLNFGRDRGISGCQTKLWQLVGFIKLESKLIAILFG